MDVRVLERDSDAAERTMLPPVDKGEGKACEEVEPGITVFPEGCPSGTWREQSWGGVVLHAAGSQSSTMYSPVMGFLQDDRNLTRMYRVTSAMVWPS